MENRKWKLENGNWKIENGNWKIGNGSWKLENGTQPSRPRHAPSGLSTYFRFSSFQFLISSVYLARVRLVMAGPQASTRNHPQGLEVRQKNM
jgi:hypothetical protein